MSVKIMSEVWENAPVSGGCLLTLLALADAANDHRITWLGINKLISKSRCSRASIYRHVDELQKKGILLRLTQHEIKLSHIEIPDYVECAWQISHSETWESQNETDVSQDETITIREPSLETSVLKNSPASSAGDFKEFISGRQDGIRKAKNRVSEYDSWPDQETKPPKEKKPKSLNARNLAVDFNDQAKVECGGLVVTNVGALSANISRFHKAGIKYEEIQACINYFMQNPKRYLFGDQQPWAGFVYKFQQIRKDCDWNDPTERQAYTPIMERPKGSRIIAKS